MNKLSYTLGGFVSLSLKDRGDRSLSFLNKSIIRPRDFILDHTGTLCEHYYKMSDEDKYVAPQEIIFPRE